MLLPARVGPAMRTAWTLLLAVLVVPLGSLALSAAFGTPFSATEQVLLAALVVMAGGWVLRRRHSNSQSIQPERGPSDLFAFDPLLLVGAGLAALLANAWYSDAKALVAHASYVASGEAECFYLLSFRLWDVTNPNATAANVRDAFSIISTPGNVLFSAGLMPAAGLQAFHAAYVLVAALLFLFVFAALRDSGISFVPAFLAAGFAVANPYTLSIEELDRNVLALLLSAALFHATQAHPERATLHGLLFGVAAGTGLRFLPVTLGVGLAFTYWNAGRPRRDWLIAFGTAALAFSPNLPHLLQHGLHSLGETNALPAATSDAGLLTRTPFVALPNVLLYPMQLLRLWGAGTCAAALAGGFLLFSKRRDLVVPLLSGLVPTLLVLSTQRDWIEGDKHRILLWALLPFFVALGAFVQSLATHFTRTALGLALALALIVGGGVAIQRFDAPADLTSRQRKPVYQSETPAFATLNRAEFSRFRLFPDFSKLFQKADLGRKARFQSLLRQQLRLDPTAPPPPAREETFVDVTLDLSALVGPIAPVVGLAPQTTALFLSLERPDELFDVYHQELRVPWQPEPLPVTVLPSAPTVRGLREITLELNAFHSLGPDADGFERVVPIQQATAGRDGGMRALPYKAEGALLKLRVPRDFRIVLRDWYLQASTGAPYRTDGWLLEVPPTGEPTLRFFPMEPESHL